MFFRNVKSPNHFSLSFIVLSLVILCRSSTAQTGPGYYELEGRSGHITENYPTFPEQYGPSNMLSFRIGKRLNGSKMWHRYYHFPYLGVDFTGGNFSNKKVLGGIFGVSAEMMFSQKLSRRWYMGEIVGAGLAWFNRPYDSNNNPDNLLIGSRITSLPHVSLGFEYYVTPYWSLWLRAAVYHASNAHYQLPNLGINLTSVCIAARFHPNPAQIINKQKTDFITNKKIRFNVRLGFGINERGGSTGPVGGPKRLTYITQFYFSKNLAAISKLQGGFEFDYSTGVYDTIVESKFFTEKQRLRATTAIFFLGHEFLMGHFSMTVQGGIYLYNPYFRERAKRSHESNTKENLRTLFIARLGFQYYIKNSVLYPKNQLYVGIYVKSNFGQADYLDLGIGYAF